MRDTSVLSCMALVPFKLLPWCWSSEEVNLSKWFFKGNCLGLQQFHLLTQSLLVFCSQKLCGLIFLALEQYVEVLVWGPWLLGPEIALRRFYPLHMNVGPAHSVSVLLLPIWMDVVVRLPFNSISDGSEWWLFYNLVVTLMWLCEEVSFVYLCHYLDWKSLSYF